MLLKTSIKKKTWIFSLILVDLGGYQITRQHNSSNNKSWNFINFYQTLNDFERSWKLAKQVGKILNFTFLLLKRGYLCKMLQKWGYLKVITQNCAWTFNFNIFFHPYTDLYSINNIHKEKNWFFALILVDLGGYHIILQHNSSKNNNGEIFINFHWY